MTLHQDVVALQRGMHAHTLCNDVALVVVQGNLKEAGVAEVFLPRTEHPALKWGNMRSQPVAI